MYIKSFSTEQFAGLIDFNTDKSRKFIPGMNVVVGNNEAGKSTMISGILRTLTTSTSLNVGSKEFKDFKAESFPTGDTNMIDSEVVFEDGGTEYVLSRKWHGSRKEEADTKLKKTGDRYLTGTDAEQKLREILKYGSAVYENLIFGRQSDEQAVLDWCSSFFGDDTGSGLDETRNVIASAVSAAGGMSPEKIREKIRAAIDRLYDNYWDDLENDRPRINKTPDGRWTKGTGEILKAYYSYKDACDRLDDAEKTGDRLAEIDELLAKLDGDEKNCRKKIEFKQNAEQNRSSRELLENRIRDIEDKINAAEKTQHDWPQLDAELKRATELAKIAAEKQNRDTRTRLDSKLIEIDAEKAKVSFFRKTAEQYPSIKTDCENAESLSRTIENVNNALSAVLLNAGITLEKGYTATVTDSDGIERNLESSEEIELNGFVKICIPGVATIQVSPKNMDVAEKLAARKEAREALEKILAGYGAESVDALKQILDTYETAENDSLNAEKEISRILEGKTEDEMRAQRDSITVDETITVGDDTDTEILNYLTDLGFKSLDAAEAGLESQIQTIKNEHGSLESIPAYIEEKTMEKAKLAEQLIALPDGEYDDDGTDYNERLKKIAAERESLTKEQGVLSVQEDNDIEGLESDRDEKHNEYLRLKEEYRLYNKMLEDFEKLAESSDDKFSGFYNKFNEYLSIITDGRVSMIMEGKKALLMSGSNRIEIGALLSEGTKRTVLLAFRLAVLDYFYPDGGGMIVLDDDLVDMDKGRQEQAAKILSRFAENNQVIVTTCSTEIAELLGGNCIRI